MSTSPSGNKKIIITKKNNKKKTEAQIDLVCLAFLSLFCATISAHDQEEKHYKKTTDVGNISKVVLNNKRIFTRLTRAPVAITAVSCVQ